MPLARHDTESYQRIKSHAAFLLTCLLRGMTYWRFGTIWIYRVSTHMPLARHDAEMEKWGCLATVSTHMPLARHDGRYIL